jgi:hypothetical protein
MSIREFPQIAPALVTLPQIPGDVAELGVWRVQFPRVPLPVLTDETRNAADLQGYFPIAAVRLVGPCLQAPCQDVTISTLDGLSRAAFTVNAFQLEQAALPVANLQVRWQIKAATSGVNTPIFNASSSVGWSPKSPVISEDAKGLIAVVSGVLCTQFELWGFIDPQQGASADVAVRVQIQVDRLGDRMAGYRGPLGGGDMLPEAV